MIETKTPSNGGGVMKDKIKVCCMTTTTGTVQEIKLN